VHTRWDKLSGSNHQPTSSIVACRQNYALHSDWFSLLVEKKNKRKNVKYGIMKRNRFTYINLIQEFSVHEKNKTVQPTIKIVVLTVFYNCWG
jgi:hypothetical protein